MTATQRRYSDLDQIEREEAQAAGLTLPDGIMPDDRLIDDREELEALRRERGGVEVAGDDIPINSFEDLEKRDRMRVAAGEGRGVSNDVLSRLNYIPTGGLKLVQNRSEGQRMQQILDRVGPDAFRQLVKDGLI